MLYYLYHGLSIRLQVSWMADRRSDNVTAWEPPMTVVSRPATFRAIVHSVQCFLAAPRTDSFSYALLAVPNMDIRTIALEHAPPLTFITVVRVSFLVLCIVHYFLLLENRVLPEFTAQPKAHREAASCG